jgi:5-carboxymethyl-2-hydroxymuconate isomerase
VPHLVVLYTPVLDRESDMGALCRHLADAMVAARDEAGKPVFPTGGVRVFAVPAAHSAVADGQHDYAFVYLNLRMAVGRSAAVKQQVGDALTAAANAHFAPLFQKRLLGMTLQVDEGTEVFDARHSTIHPLFNNKG